MSKEITKAYILQQITEKLGLREFVPTQFTFEEGVMPVYNIEPHLIKRICAYEERSITEIGGMSFFTVPDTERWRLNAYTVTFMGAGAIKVSGVYLNRRSFVGIQSYLDLTKNQAVSYCHYLPGQLTLDPGDKLNINIDEYTSTQALRLYVDYEMETIR